MLDKLDGRALLEKAVACADQMQEVAKKLEKEKIGAGSANALVNSYRSAGSLYLSVANATEGCKILVHSSGTPTELSEADRERLDNISKLLTEKPRKRAREGQK